MPKGSHVMQVMMESAMNCMMLIFKSQNSQKQKAE